MKANNVTFVCADCGSKNIDVLANAERTGNSTCACGAHLSQTPTANGIPAAVIAIIQKYSGAIPAEMLQELVAMPGADALLTEVTAKIQEGGYINSPVIVKRWVNAQIFRMLEDELEDRLSVHNQIQNRGWNYAWKVVYNEWKALKKMDQDPGVPYKEQEKRLRFYSFSVVAQMMRDYTRELEKYLNDLRYKGKMRKCRGMQYIRFRCSWNDGKGLFIYDIDAYIRRYREILAGFSGSHMLNEKFNALEKFVKMVRNNSWNPVCKSKAFLNAYKAVGGYYTLKDLIMFEGRRIILGSMEDNLDYLERRADEILGKNGCNTEENGYMLLGMLKQALGNVDHQRLEFVKDRSEKWHQAYEERRNNRRNANRR